MKTCFALLLDSARVRVLLDFVMGVAIDSSYSRIRPLISNTCFFKLKMATLVEYGSSGEGSDEDAPEINYEESAKVLSSLKDKFSMNSTPAVRNKV